MLDTTRQLKQNANVTLVFDDKSDKPRVRLEVGTWYDIEFLPSDSFFKVCAEYWKNRESVRDEQTKFD